MTERLMLWICIPILAINLFRWIQRDSSVANILIEKGEYSYAASVGHDLANGVTKDELIKQNCGSIISEAEADVSFRQKFDLITYTLGCLAIFWFCKKEGDTKTGLGIITVASFFDYGCLGIEFIAIAPLLSLVVPAIGFGKLFGKLK